MDGITWVYIMLGIYVVYAFWQGLQGFFAEKTSSGYAIGGRSVPFIAFLIPSCRSMTMPSETAFSLTSAAVPRFWMIRLMGSVAARTSWMAIRPQ